MRERGWEGETDVIFYFAVAFAFIGPEAQG
jgi:hypothetical protein